MADVDLHGGTAQLDVLTLYGLRLEGLLPALVLPLLLTMVLFAGPLVLGYFDEDLPGQSNFSWRSDVLATLTSYVGVRNFIVVWTRVCYVLASWFSVDLGTRNRRDCVSVLLRYNHVSRRLFQPDHRLLLPTVLWSWYILSPLAAFFLFIGHTPHTAHFHKLRDAYKKSVLHGKRENSFKELLLQTRTYVLGFIDT